METERQLDYFVINEGKAAEDSNMVDIRNFSRCTSNIRAISRLIRGGHIGLFVDDHCSF